MLEYFREKLYIPVPLHGLTFPRMFFFPFFFFFFFLFFFFLSRCFNNCPRNQRPEFNDELEFLRNVLYDAQSLRNAFVSRQLVHGRYVYRLVNDSEARIDGKAVLIPVPRIFGLYARNNGRTGCSNSRIDPRREHRRNKRFASSPVSFFLLLFAGRTYLTTCGTHVHRTKYVPVGSTSANESNLDFRSV